MRLRMCLVVLSVLLACGKGKPPVEPELGGGESPAAFQRAIGLTLLRTGQPRRALPYLQRLVRLAPKRADSRCFVARAFLDMTMWEQSRAAIGEALAIDPRHAPAHSLLGVLLDAQGEHAEARNAHRRAIAFDPENAGYHNNLGFSLYLDGRYVDALAAFNRTLRYAPNLRRVHNNLGFTLGKLGRIDEARDHFQRGGDEAEAANNLGMVLEERGELERAYEAFVTAVDRSPDLVQARGNLERICERLGKPVPVISEGRK